jgi:hypothetical protein
MLHITHASHPSQGFAYIPAKMNQMLYTAELMMAAS